MSWIPIKLPHRRRRGMPNLNVPPGTMQLEEGAARPVLTAFGFSPQGFEETTLRDPAEIQSLLAKWPVVWLNVDGLGDEAMLRQVGDTFGIHPLAMEDVTDTTQRAKVESYGDNAFLVVPMPQVHREGHRFESEQLSLYLTDRAVVSFQATAPGDCLNLIRDRIRTGRGRVRTSNAAYLAYALIDTVIDAYFPLVSGMGDRLEELEERIVEDVDVDQIHDIRAIKVDLMRIRRAVWPMRDAVMAMGMLDHMYGQDLRPYLRDAQDHVARLMDLLETDRFTASDLMEIYLTAISNRLGEVNRFLTVVATIFIPLGFIASVYGMNFEPDSPWNMPELKWYFGYPFALGLMLLTALGFMGYFWWKGWLGSQSFSASGRGSRLRKP
ncbi:MAG: magnesium/cobalt transporter CorA [Phycisphaerales bacterium]|jgi:magnesium transporter